MEVVGGNTLLPGDPRLIDHIVCELKSQGIFDQFRKECIADVDTKPAYQNLRQRVEGSVTGFLKTQNWRPDMNKNQLREMLRKNIYESGFLETGVERIVDQVVNPKINTVFLPQVEEVVYKFLGLAKPTRNATYSPSNGPLSINTVDLLPTDLDPISPDSEVLNKSADKPPDVEPEPEAAANLDDSKNDEFESPPFEPINEQTVYEAHDDSSNDSRISGISGLTSHDSNMSDGAVAEKSIFDVNNQDSQLSKVSSNSRLSIVTTDSKHTPEKMDISDDNTEDCPAKIEEITPNITANVTTVVKEEIRDELEEIRMEINGHIQNKTTVTVSEVQEVKTEVTEEITNTVEGPVNEKKEISEEITDNSDKKEETTDNTTEEPQIKEEMSSTKEEISPKEEIKETVEADSKKTDRHRHDSEKRKHSDKDRKDDKKSDKDKKDKDKYKSSSSSSRDKDKHREKSRDNKSSKDKDGKSRDERDKSRDNKTNKEEKDKGKSSSSTSKHSSRDRNRSSSKSESKSSKDSRDPSKSKTSSSSAKKSDSSKSRSRDHSKSDSSKHTSKDRKSGTSSKDYRDKKDGKKSSKREQDDHSSSRDKKSDTRRSADRDSNDGSSGVNNTSSTTKEKDSSTSSNKSKSDNSDFSGSNSGDSGGQSDNNNCQNNQETLKVDITLDEVALNPAPLMKMKKPKIASNIFEVRKLMKIRKKMEKMEKKRQRQHELAAENKNTQSPNSVDDTDSVDSESLLNAPHNIDELVKNIASITGEDIGEQDDTIPNSTAIVSKESWDAIEAKLSQSAHENVDFNLYAEDTGDSSSNSKPDESSLRRSKRLSEEEDCLYFSNEVSPTTERFLQSIETFREKSLLELQSKRPKKSNEDSDNYFEGKKKTVKGKKRKLDGEDKIDTENNNKKVIGEMNDVLDTLTASPSGSNLSNGSIESKPKSRAKKTKKTVNSPSSDADSENLETRRNSRASILKNQRYSSDDLYKPRPVVSGTSRRQRGLLNNTDKKN